MRKIGSKEHFVLAIRLQVMNQLRWVVPRRVGGGVNENVLVLPGYPDHFVGPGMPNMPRNNAQFGEGQSFLSEKTWDK